jgi:hypothetical protein
MMNNVPLKSEIKTAGMDRRIAHQHTAAAYTRDISHGYTNITLSAI